jgi:murein DD-endopeptidase MepM/ murein hydrolase activator NlpD
MPPEFSDLGYGAPTLNPGAYLWPLAPPFRRVSSPFGWRIHPIRMDRHFHSGADIACPVGSVIVAPGDGVIYRLWNDRTSGGGLSMIVRFFGSQKKFRIGFAHLSAAFREPGDTVRAGDILGLTGGMPNAYGAGASTAPHLHITLRNTDNMHAEDPVSSVRWMEWPRDMAECIAMMNEQRMCRRSN